MARAHVMTLADLEGRGVGMGMAIRRAGAADRDAVTKLLDEAFHNDPVSSWVFPDPEHRRRKHGVLMGAFLDGVLAEGYVDMLEDGSAAALWMSLPAGDHSDSEGPAQFRQLVDPDNYRVEQIARITEAAHPKDRPHEYLQLIAVDQRMRSQGAGTALINGVLERCDREGLSAYLEASSMRSRALYERLGFVFTGRTVDLPDGPHMWPMWRDPQPLS